MNSFNVKEHTQNIGRSVGGLTTKIHALCDSLGNPLKLILTGGNTHDSVVATSLLKGYKAQNVLADKAYGSKEIIELAKSNNIEVVIPSKVNSINPRIIDTHKYKSRGLIENLFQRLKVYRRVSTRYDKLDKNFIGFVYLACIFKWLH